MLRNPISLTLGFIFSILQPAIVIAGEVSPSEPYLWANAVRVDDEWRHSDWYGFLSDSGFPWIWHAEHGWQWCEGEAESSIFLLDMELDSWIWTGKAVYPWIYKFGANDGWIFYFEGGAVGDRWFYHVPKDDFYRDVELRTQIEDPPIPGLPKPAFSVPGGTFTGELSVTLETAVPNASIHFTMDGSVPTGQSPLYGGPLVLTGITQLRARVVVPGMDPGPVGSEVYLALDAELADFNSTLPIVVLDSFGRDIEAEVYDRGTENTWPQRPVSAVFIDTDATTDRADIVAGPAFTGRAGMRVRGNSSQDDFPKKSYKFEVWDEFDEDRDVSLLGFPAESDWILHAPYTDKTLMRNFITYSWSRKMGNYVTRTRYIEVFANMDGDDVVSYEDYIGVYVLMEKVKRHKDRIDIARLRPTDLAEPDITGGYILKADWGDDFQLDRTQLLMEYVDPDLDELAVEQRAWIEGYINDVESAVFAPDYLHPETGEHYTDLVDARSCIERQVIQELTKNMDARSTFLYKDRNQPLRFGPVWDYNYALGNADYNWTWCRDCFGACPCYAPQGWATFYYTPVNDRTMRWWSRFKEDPDYWQYWVDRWAEVRRDVLSTDAILAEMDSLFELLEEPAARNFVRWPVLNVKTRGNSYWGTPQDPHTYEDEVVWLMGWLTTRLDWIDSQFLKMPDFNRDGGPIAEGFSLELSNPNPTGRIYYTLDGTDPRFPVRWPGGESTKTVLVTEADSKNVLVPTGPLPDDWTGPLFEDSGWTNGTGGVGYDRQNSAAFQNIIGVDVEAEMRGNNGTCYIRIPFSVKPADSASFRYLGLEILYDDGFVAYLNGNRVAEANTPATLEWNSTATASRDSEEALVPMVYDLSGFLGDLNPGEENILAIRGLNDRAYGSDFLISCRLIVDDQVLTLKGGLSDRAIEYANPITLSRTTIVNARVRIDDEWGPLHREVFTTSSVQENLRITEIHYHPVTPTAEFIELQNIGDEAIELNQVRFTDGVEFTFPGRVLAPGDVVLVVADEAIFETEYGSGLPVAGVYSGRLSNGGERIELVDAIDRVILEFNYSDEWIPATDGDGYSLVFIDPFESDLSSWNRQSSWRASESVGGTPGAGD